MILGKQPFSWLKPHLERLIPSTMTSHHFTGGSGKTFSPPKQGLGRNYGPPNLNPSCLMNVHPKVNPTLQTEF